VVEQPIRNRQVVGSTPTLGSTYPIAFQLCTHFQLTRSGWFVARSLQVSTENRVSRKACHPCHAATGEITRRAIKR
jgi:hypothetical protein